MAAAGCTNYISCRSARSASGAFARQFRDRGVHGLGAADSHPQRSHPRDTAQHQRRLAGGPLQPQESAGNRSLAADDAPELEESRLKSLSLQIETITGETR